MSVSRHDTDLSVADTLSLRHAGSWTSDAPTAVESIKEALPIFTSSPAALTVILPTPTLLRALPLQYKLPEGSISIRGFNEDDKKWLQEHFYKKPTNLREVFLSYKATKQLVRNGVSTRKTRDETLDTKGFIAERLVGQGCTDETREASMIYYRIKHGTHAYVDYACHVTDEEDRQELLKRLTIASIQSARRDEITVLWIDEPRGDWSGCMKQIGYKEDENGPPDYVYEEGVKASNARWFRLDLDKTAKSSAE